MSESASGTEPQPQTGLAAAVSGAQPSPAASNAANPAPARERLASWTWIGLAIVLVLGFFCLLAPILTPFALAGVLAYMLQPGVDWLERRRLPWTLGTTLMVVLAAAFALGLVLILLPVIEREALALDQQLPALVTQLNARVTPLLEQWLGITVHFNTAALRAVAMQHIGQQDFTNMLLATFGSGSLAVVQALGTMVLIPVVLFYLLLDGPHIKAQLEAGIPRRWHPQTMQMLADVDAVLAQFLRGQLTVMLLLAIYYSVAMTIAGFDSALPIGILTGLLICIPYVGFALGLVLASVVALLQFAAWQACLDIALIYGLGQILEGFFLTPRLVGKRIGLHPLAVIFALLAFGHVFGFFGVLVALPASAALLVALRRVQQHYLASALYNRT